MRLASIVEQFEPALMQLYGSQLLPSAYRALRAIKQCQGANAPHWLANCSQCPHIQAFPHSCGHRACPHCQHGVGERWLQQQRQRRLPVDYFLVTFTLPSALRPLAYRNQREVYDAMLRTAWQTLRQFARNDAKLNGDIGVTAVLHTHNRRRDLHPHVHVVVPAGSVNTDQMLWRSKSGYLFNARNLAKTFVAKLLAQLRELKLTVPSLPQQQWIADCRHVGAGDKALIYLSRYLYRGVLSERDIVACNGDQVSFRYTEAKTKKSCIRTLSGAEFLWLLLQHVLPRRFRRVRDYGLLHPNRKTLLQRVQCLLQVQLSIPTTPTAKPPMRCRLCGAPMRHGPTRLPATQAIAYVHRVQAARSKLM